MKRSQGPIALCISSLAACQQGGVAEGARSAAFDASITRSIEAAGESGRGFVIVVGPRGPWTATVRGTGGSRAVSADRCPALTSAVAAFQAMPQVTGGWPRPSGDPHTIPVPPTRVHGENWRVSSAGFFPDVSQVNLTVEGSQGPYAGWAARTFADLSACADG